jgi:hypothetical protein
VNNDYDFIKIVPVYSQSVQRVRFKDESFNSFTLIRLHVLPKGNNLKSLKTNYFFDDIDAMKVNNKTLF